MDIIKDFEEKISNNLIKYLRDNPEFLKENINSFEDELKYIGSNNPILIAFSNDCYKLLIVTGGTIQLWFGIKGDRWKNNGWYNEYWCNVLESEIPENKEKVEGGCYY